MQNTAKDIEKIKKDIKSIKKEMKNLREYSGNIDLLKNLFIEVAGKKIRLYSGCLVDVDGASDIVNYSVSYLRQYRNKKGMPPYHKMGGKVFYNIKDLKKWGANLPKFNTKNI